MDTQLCYLELESCKLKFVFQRFNYIKILVRSKDVIDKCSFNATLIPTLADSTTMNDIRYKWNDGLNSVQISSDSTLREWKILGHRQKTIERSLSTGNFCSIIFNLA